MDHTTEMLPFIKKTIKRLETKDVNEWKQNAFLIYGFIVNLVLRAEHRHKNNNIWANFKDKTIFRQNRNLKTLVLVILKHKNLLGIDNSSEMFEENAAKELRKILDKLYTYSQAFEFIQQIQEESVCVYK
jgi:hypothetical protein